MADLWYIKFCPNDWLGDPAVASLSPASVGIWINLICNMHQAGNTGQVTETMEGLARMVHCTVDELALALDELARKGTAKIDRKVGHVALGCMNVTVTCRRMQREYEARVASRKRMRKSRRCANVARHSQSYSHSYSQQQQTAAAPEPPSGAAADVLRTAGIGEPAASRIADLPGMTRVSALLLVEEARRANPRNLAGWIVHHALANGYRPAETVEPRDFCRLVRTGAISTFKGIEVKLAKWNSSGVSWTGGDGGLVKVKPEELRTEDMG